MKTTRPSFALAGLVGLTLLAGCGSDATTAASPATTEVATTAALTTTALPATTELSATTALPATVFPVTISAANGPVTIAAAPTKIVSLSPTATEMLFAIGAGSQVVAVDANSNYPAGVPTTDLSGFEPNVEAIAGYQPDLVVLSDDMGGIVAALSALKIPVLQEPAAATIDDSYAQLEQIGAATGHVADAAGIVADMQTKLDAIVASTPRPATPISIYHELDDTYYSATSKTFIGALYAKLSLINIADAADKDGSGYPQLSVEYIVKANPSIVLLADTKCCKQSAATVAARPGWDKISAVADGRVVELDDDVASRWGPRVVDLLQAVETAVAQVSVGA